MIAIPAIDLRDGACVQLVGGSYADERVRIPDPLVAVERWTAAGFRRLHVVDLDAATGAGSNDARIDAVMAASSIPMQVGGGIRSTAKLSRLIERGADQVVVGTRAVEDRDWLIEVASANPGRVLVAADVRGRKVATHGWRRGGSGDVGELARSLASLPIAGILVTAIDREGRMGGTDLELMAEIARSVDVPVIASGGIARLEELRALARRGVYGAVLGMSLYTGALDPRAVAGEFGE